MSTNWYYVENNERIGPVDEKEFLSLLKGHKIIGETYVWRKGFDNWLQAKKLDELQKYLDLDSMTSEDQLSEGITTSDEESDLLEGEKTGDAESEKIKFSWEDLNHDEQIFVLRIGEDRGSSPREYGPYTLKMIEKLLKQKRINHLTELFAPGMGEWTLIGDTDYFKNKLKIDMQNVERRKSKRCPLSARVFLSDNEEFFQGVCRDVSIGGAQVLVANFNGNEGDEVKVNMHLNDGSFAFTARGKIIRSLSRVGGFAMRFVDLSPSSITMINEYIENYE